MHLYFILIIYTNLFNTKLFILTHKYEIYWQWIYNNLVDKLTAHCYDYLK